MFGEDNVPKISNFIKVIVAILKRLIMKGVDVVYHCAATAHEGLSVFSPYET